MRNEIGQLLGTITPDEKDVIDVSIPDKWFSSCGLVEIFNQLGFKLAHEYARVIRGHRGAHRSSHDLVVYFRTKSEGI